MFKTGAIIKNRQPTVFLNTGIHLYCDADKMRLKIIDVKYFLTFGTNIQISIFTNVYVV